MQILDKLLTLLVRYELLTITIINKRKKNRYVQMYIKLVTKKKIYSSVWIIILGVDCFIVCMYGCIFIDIMYTWRIIKG